MQKFQLFDNYSDLNHNLKYPYSYMYKITFL